MLPNSLYELYATKRILGGQNRVRLYTDMGGRRYAVKSLASAEDAVHEDTVLSIYRLMGANVPESRVFYQDGQWMQISRYIPRLLPLGRFVTTMVFGWLCEKISEHFALDALLANMDVIGNNPSQGYDNIMVGTTLSVYRIEGGGGLGGSTPLTEYPHELWTLRDPLVDDTAASVFGDLAWSDIIQQMQVIFDRRQDIMEAIADPETRRLIEVRLMWYRDIIEDAMKPSPVFKGDVDVKAKS